MSKCKCGHPHAGSTVAKPSRADVGDLLVKGTCLIDRFVRARSCSLTGGIVNTPDYMPKRKRARLHDCSATPTSNLLCGDLSRKGRLKVPCCTSMSSPRGYSSDFSRNAVFPSTACWLPRATKSNSPRTTATSAQLPLLSFFFGFGFFPFSGAPSTAKVGRLPPPR